MDRNCSFYFSVLLMHWFYLIAGMSINMMDIGTDQSALLVLKARNALDPENQLAKNWSSSSSVCNWMGVTCSARHHRVAALNVSNLGLTGSIPPELGNLSFLVSLDMSGNAFRGNLPEELTRLKRLRFMSFSFNELTGGLPSWYEGLPKLQDLSLDYNSFSGAIPRSLFNSTKLETLNLQNNSLRGSIPEEIGNLQNMKVLRLGINKLSGEFPSWIGFLTELQYLSLGNNSLSGFIPPSISNLSKLEHLDVQYNSLQGRIPEQMGFLPSLKRLNMRGNSFTGPIPFTIFNISTLEAVEFSRNSLSGSLPVDICRHTPGLQKLQMGLNSIGGQIPPHLSECSELRSLFLSYNNFSGYIPREISNLMKLEELYIGENDLTGEIPREIGNLTMLKILDFIGSNLTGAIPKEIGNLHNLVELGLSANWLKGSIPTEIFNISTIKLLRLSTNNLSGSLPSSMGYKLNNLEILRLHENDLTGVIPSSISNATKLISFILLLNKFSGAVPDSFGNMRDLRFFSIARNRLSNDPSTPELSFFTGLANCRSLRYLIVNDNPLNAFLPASIGNLSTSLENIYAARCKLKGRIPNEIGNLSSLLLLDLSQNELIGSVPRTIQNLQNLQRVSFGSNKIGGPFPNGFCELHNLGIIDLRSNEILGPIPECFGNITSLREIYLDSNRFTSIPTSVWNHKHITILSLSSNSIDGSLPPEMGNLEAATTIDLSSNQLAGFIPTTIGDLKSVKSLSVANNSLQGSIPVSIGNMLSLEILDLSHNNLSGSIPKSLEELQSLTYFNVSINGLSGEIPTGGPFRNFTNQSFMFNKAFCGSSRFNVPPCRSGSAGKSRKRKVLRVVFILSGFAAVLLATIVAIVVVKYRKKQKHPGGTDFLLADKYGRFSYYELLQATGAYCESNLLGTGSFGSVYRAVLRDGTHLAIKVFNLQMEDAFKSFDRECEVLRNIRHRNLTKVIGSCSNYDFKALVLEYMSNGSLEKWLYSHNHFLDLKQRLDIMVDVACALEYLHHSHTIPVLHCDLKPSNILLDEDMVGHLSDFGVAKMLSEGQSAVHTRTLATLGYIAPEYGLDGLVSTRTDVYSFGIVVMETFSRMKPNDEMFSGDLSLKSWIEDSLNDAAIQIIDTNLLSEEDPHVARKMDCISKTLALALSCCKEYPGERMNMKDVVVAIKKIRHQFVTSAQD